MIYRYQGPEWPATVIQDEPFSSGSVPLCVMPSGRHVEHHAQRQGGSNRFAAGPLHSAELDLGHIRETKARFCCPVLCLADITEQQIHNDGRCEFMTPFAWHCRLIYMLDKVQTNAAQILSCFMLHIPGSSLLCGRQRGGLRGSCLLSGNLVLRLLVAVRDQPVKEATRPALVLTRGLCLFDLPVEVSGGLVIEILVFVVVGYTGVSTSVLLSAESKHTPFLSCMLSFLVSFWRMDCILTGCGLTVVVCGSCGS